MKNVTSCICSGNKTVIHYEDDEQLENNTMSANNLIEVPVIYNGNGIQKTIIFVDKIKMVCEYEEWTLIVLTDGEKFYVDLSFNEVKQMLLR